MTSAIEPSPKINKPKASAKVAISPGLRVDKSDKGVFRLAQTLTTPWNEISRFEEWAEYWVRMSRSFGSNDWTEFRKFLEAREAECAASASARAIPEFVMPKPVAGLKPAPILPRDVTAGTLLPYNGVTLSRWHAWWLERGAPESLLALKTRSGPDRFHPALLSWMQNEAEYKSPHKMFLLQLVIASRSYVPVVRQMGQLPAALVAQESARAKVFSDPEFAPLREALVAMKIGPLSTNLLGSKLTRSQFAVDSMESVLRLDPNAPACLLPAVYEWASPHEYDPDVVDKFKTKAIHLAETVKCVAQRTDQDLTDVTLSQFADLTHRDILNADLRRRYPTAVEQVLPTIQIIGEGLGREPQSLARTALIGFTASLGL